MYIDVHVHCRDWDQSNVATIKDVMKLARKYKIVAIGDMPNTTPKIDTLELAYKRVKTARDEHIDNGFYFHMGITTDPKQIKEAVRAFKEIPECIGIKMYGCSSTNDPGVQTPEEQFLVYRELAQNDYDGVLTVHCEKESYFDMTEWNPSRPYSWNYVRPEIAESESIRDQIEIWKEIRPKFSIHMAHISSGRSLIHIDSAQSDGIKISCGVTPHHILYSTKMMQDKSGLRYKVNPPLRSEESAEELRNLFVRADLIETDHAPHDKLKKRGMGCEIAPSGIQSLHLYPLLIEKMPEWGIEEKRIHELTYKNPKKIFPKIEVRV